MKQTPIYDIALSFAGEDRKLAKKLTSLLSQKGIKVFYDEHEQASLWGKDLYQHLQEIYRDRAKYCVIFVSKHYANKLWTRHELKQAQARAFIENEEYILPIRLDDTEIPGINPTVAYLDIRQTKISTIAELLLKKIKITSEKENIQPQKNKKTPLRVLLFLIATLLTSAVFIIKLITQEKINTTRPSPIQHQEKNTLSKTIDYFGFYIGNSWTFNIAQELHSEDKEFNTEYGNNSFKQIIKHVDYNYKKDSGIVTIEQKGINPFERCDETDIFENTQELKNKSIMFWYIFSKGILFKACSRDEAQEIYFDDNRDTNFSENIEYSTPFYIDKEWGLQYHGDDASEHKKLRWHVSNIIEEITLPSGTYKDCAEITWNDNTGYIQRYVCEDVGLISEKYYHRGTINNTTIQLVDFRTEKRQINSTFLE